MPLPGYHKYISNSEQFVKPPSSLVTSGITLNNFFLAFCFFSGELFSYLEILSSSEYMRKGRAREAGAHNAWCELTPCANPCSVFQEKEWNRCKHGRNKANECCGPLYAHLHAHRVRTKRLGENIELTFVNICAVNRGKAAAVADRIIVLAARADAANILRAQQSIIATLNRTQNSQICIYKVALEYKS
jgi:hypothetical protein